MSNFYPASKNSTNPIGTLKSENFISPQLQIINATKYSYSPTTDLYGSLGPINIIWGGSGIPYNTNLVFSEPTISGGITASGFPVFGLSKHSINIVTSGSGHSIGNTYYAFHQDSFMPSVLFVSATGVNGSISDLEIAYPGINYSNDSNVSFSLDSDITGIIPATLEFVPDQFCISDINIYPKSQGYKIFESNNLKSKKLYPINTNNNSKIVAFSMVGNISKFIFNESNDYLRSNRTKNQDLFSEKVINFNDPSMRPITPYSYLDQEIITPTISVINNEQIYSYTTSSCLEDSDCFSCPENSIEVIGVDGYTKICCPEGSTGVFPIGDPRQGRCCEDCSESSIEQGESGSLPSASGYCCDGQCSNVPCDEIPAPTGETPAPTGETPANTGCIENIPETSGNISFDINIDPETIALGQLGLNGSGGDSSREAIERSIEEFYYESREYSKKVNEIKNRRKNGEINKIAEEIQLNQLAYEYRKKARDRIRKLQQNGHIDINNPPFIGGSVSGGKGSVSTQELDEMFERFAKRNNLPITPELRERYYKDSQYFQAWIDRGAKNREVAKEARRLQRQIHKERQEGRKKQPKVHPQQSNRSTPPLGSSYTQGEWDRIQAFRKKREKCFGINLDNAKYQWKGMSNSQKRKIIRGGIISAVAAAATLGYQFFARGSEYESEAVNEILDWVDFIGQADPSTPWIDTVLGTELGDGTFESYSRTAEDLLGAYMSGQINEEELNAILDEVDPKVKDAIIIRMNVPPGSTITDALNKAKAYKDIIAESITESDVIGDSDQLGPFNEYDPYDYLLDEDGNFKPIDEIIPPDFDEEESCDVKCYNKDNSYSSIRAPQEPPKIPVSVEYPVLKANEFYG